MPNRHRSPSAEEDPARREGDAAHEAAAWEALLALAGALRRADPVPRRVSMRLGRRPAAAIGADLAPGDGTLVVIDTPDLAAGTGGGPRAAGPAPPPAATRLRLEGLTVLRHAGGPALPVAARRMVELYLPYCLAPPRARASGRAFAVAHLAQSLDGYVATRDGDSKWIGCEENLRHAHRMRALCDAVLVGARTFESDRPRLNVRHADGEDPVRVVLGRPRGPAPLDDGPSEAPLWIVRGEQPRTGGAVPAGGGQGAGAGAAEERRARGEATIRHLTLPAEHGRVSGEVLLRALFERGIRSVYVEGGARTTSGLLADGALDVVQVHVAPVVLGAGTAALEVAPAARIQDALRFARSRFHRVGEGAMLVAEPGAAR